MSCLTVLLILVPRNFSSVLNTPTRTREKANTSLPSLPSLVFFLLRNSYSYSKAQPQYQYQRNPQIYPGLQTLFLFLGRPRTEARKKFRAHEKMVWKLWGKKIASVLYKIIHMHGLDSRLHTSQGPCIKYAHMQWCGLHGTRWICIEPLVRFLPS